MAWGNHCRLRNISLWIVIVVSLSLSHFIFLRDVSLVVYVFSFFSLSWQLKCTIIICLFVVFLGQAKIVRPKTLGSSIASWTKSLGFDGHARPKAFGFNIVIVVVVVFSIISMIVVGI